MYGTNHVDWSSLKRETKEDEKEDHFDRTITKNNYTSIKGKSLYSKNSIPLLFLPLSISSDHKTTERRREHKLDRRDKELVKLWLFLLVRVKSHPKNYT